MVVHATLAMILPWSFTAVGMIQPDFKYDLCQFKTTNRLATLSMCQVAKSSILQAARQILATTLLWFTTRIDTKVHYLNLMRNMVRSSTLVERFGIHVEDQQSPRTTLPVFSTAIVSLLQDSILVTLMGTKYLPTHPKKDTHANKNNNQ